MRRSCPKGVTERAVALRETGTNDCIAEAQYDVSDLKLAQYSQRSLQSTELFSDGEKWLQLSEHQKI